MHAFFIIPWTNLDDRLRQQVMLMMMMMTMRDKADSWTIHHLSLNCHRISTDWNSVPAALPDLSHHQHTVSAAITT